MPWLGGGKSNVGGGQPWVAMASFVAVLLVLALGHRWSVTASWFTSDNLQHALVWIATACSARGCGSFMKKVNLAVYVEGTVLLNM